MALTVRIEVQGTPLEAVVANGAGHGAGHGSRKTPVRRQMTMLHAGNGDRLKGFIAGLFDVKAGQSAHQVDLYVATLNDSMVLGMNFLQFHRTKLDLDAGTLCFGDETICMIWGRSPVPPELEAQVTLIRKIKVPSGSAVLCPVRLDVGLGDFSVVPGVHLPSDILLMHHTYHASGDSTAVCLINASDKGMLLAAESAVGRAVEADLHVPVPLLSRSVPLLRRPHPRKCPYISKTC